MRVEEWNGHSIRFVEHLSDWWAVAVDFEAALEMTNIRATLALFPEDEVDEVNSIYTVKRVVSHGKDTGKTIKQANKMQVVNELGIYRLIFQSRMPEAEAFRKWVFRIIKEIREEVLGLKSYEAFRLMDKEHQRAAMQNLCNSLREPVKVDYIKANMIADKAVSTIHGFPKLIKKPDMDEGMLREREPILTDTVELMALNERFGLGLSVSEQIYRKYTGVTA
jgi:prophage antirepressor-like protein